MSPRVSILGAALTFLAILPQSSVRAATFICGTSDTIQQVPGFVRFYPVRSGNEGADLIWRDAEFMWDSLYADGGTGDVALTLRSLAESLVDRTGHNPFGAPYSHIRLIYDYFHREGVPYNTTNPSDSSMIFGSTFPPNYGGPLSAYKPTDRSHADCYIFNGPARGITLGGTYPSGLYTDDEDVTSDRAVGDVKAANTIKVGGPPASRKIDVAGTGWTHPDSGFFVGFNHEFQHGLPPGQTGGFSTEMFSAGAEAIGGHADTTGVVDEVPYTWSLVGQTNFSAVNAPPCSGEPSLTCVRAIGSNYQGRTMFGAYLAYNFRGADTTATLSAMADDLLWKWVRSPLRRIDALRDLLDDADCGTCAGKNYFHPGGVPLDNVSRMALLHHNFRVANYVNKSSLEEGQYGYPPQFGFAPDKHLKAWQDFDNAGTDDLVAVPPEVTLTATHRNNEKALRGSRSHGGNTYPLVLQPFGSEYWVVKSDPSIWAPGQDLVVRVTPEDVHRARHYLGFSCAVPDNFNADARLVASVVAYSPPSGSVAGARLWEHPEWAARAFPPKWIDVDSLANPLEFVVPSFGDSFKAVVVVLSLADGPSQTYSGEALDHYVEALHYRVDLSLRTTPLHLLDPIVVSATASYESSPTWSPIGDEVAYQVGVGGASSIERRPVAGGNAQLVTTGREPDWSPRGDRIALVRDSVAAEGRVWVYDTLSAQATKLTVKPGGAVSPVFSPNGQRIAYARSVNDFPAQGPGCCCCGWELRWVDVSGVNDTLLLRERGEYAMRSIRWSPDGSWIWLLKPPTLPDGTAGSTALLVVPANGGPPVTRAGLVDDAVSFDLHRGSGPLLLAQASAIQVPSPCERADGSHIVDTTFVADPFQRLALRDTLSGDTRSRFYRTGASFFAPRWSPEGTQVAYSSNQNSANGSGDLDLFVGRVSFNRTPTFVNPSADVLVHTGKSFELTANATDPLGESLTYQAPAAFLPSGSSFTPATRRFSWPNPGPVCSEHFVVFRALDGSSGVVSRVVKITAVIDSVDDLTADLIGDTHVWITWNAPGDNGALGRGVQYDLRYAQIPLNEGTFGSATPVSGMGAPAVPGSPEIKDVGGLSPGTTYYFGLKTKDARGNWSLLSNVVQASTIGGGGAAPGAQAAAAGQVMLRRAIPAAGEAAGADGASPVVSVEMSVGGDVRSWTVRELGAAEIAGLGPMDSVAVLLQIRDVNGAWFTRGRIPLRDAAWRFAVRALCGPGRILFRGDYQARQAWSSVAVDGYDGAASLVTARHSRLGDLTGSFDANGSAAVDMTPTDTLTLAYELTGETQNAADWFLLVGPPGSNVSAPARAVRGRDDASPIPTAFALRQNQPNPFSQTTMIRFELPIETQVDLEVFDAQGRLVRSLAGSRYPAGFHGVVWDQRDEGGRPLGAGVYLYRLRAGTFRDQRKMVLLSRQSAGAP